MTNTENLDDDFGTYARDAEQERDAEIHLEDPEATDDTPWSPPERQPRGAEYADLDPADEETIDQRIMQEVPEEGTAYGAPDHESDPEPTVGGDDRDAIPAEDDVLGVDEAQSLDDPDLRTDLPAEQAAMHLTDEPGSDADPVIGEPEE
ncbi:MAG: adenosine deaminase [Micrococcales bacterium]|nr:adenosine deaminase [Micrococcales bacterium]